MEQFLLAHFGRKPGRSDPHISMHRMQAVVQTDDGSMGNHQNEKRTAAVACPHSFLLQGLPAAGTCQCLLKRENKMDQIDAGVVWFQGSGQKWGSGNCHFSLSLSIQILEKENKKTLFLFHFSFLQNHFLTSTLPSTTVNFVIM